MGDSSGKQLSAVIPLSVVGGDFSPPDNQHEKPEMFQGITLGLPPIPNGLDSEARKHWKFIGEKLVAANMLSEVDLGQFRILCETWALYLSAQKKCVDPEFGEWQKTPNNYQQLAPWAIARERHANRYQKVSDKFFLSPRARKSVDIANPSQGSLDLSSGGD